MQSAKTARKPSRNILLTALEATILLLVADSLFAQNTTDIQSLFSRVRQSDNLSDRLLAAGRIDYEVRHGSDYAALLKAANFGNPEAQTSVGYLYANGLGLPRDVNQAFHWFQRAAAENYAPAQFDIGYLLMAGIGVEQDMSQAVHWFERAAGQGLPPAETLLALAYHNGLGVSPDQSSALH